MTALRGQGMGNIVDLQHRAPEAPSEVFGPIDESVGPIGGQALPEGVMMRRGASWGAAVRCPDGSITTISRTLPASLDGWRKLPLVRGVLALGETATLGTRATLWAARERGDERGEGYSRGGLVLTVAIALIGVFGIFGLLPAVIVKAVGVTNPALFSLGEGLIRLAILVGYLALLGRSPQVKRVFAYHGAEHMTIHAFEHRVPLTPEGIRAFDRRHPRCGTAFLLVVVIVTMFAHALVGHPGWGLLVASRILGLPVVAGVAYEAIKFAGRHQHQLVGKVLMAPGSWLQTITTNEPTDDMIEVAVAALEATLAAEPLTAEPLAAEPSTASATLAATIAS
ncbi:MAG: hypothetical protein JWM47_2695 [Acidimicrobiales bacterium]|nr:hypothetical protein [Acidimicrobiales bacterium]